MRNNSQKLIFLLVVVGAIAISGILRPSLFFSGGTSSADAGLGGAAAQAANTPPLLVLPSLTANIGAQGLVVASDSAGSTDVNTGNNSGAGTTKTPIIGAAVALIADLTTGKSYLNINGDERWPLASVSKLMTAAVATDALSPDQHITITEQMLAADPTQHILNLGDTYTVADLLHVMLLPSNNVAAEALAQFYGRDRFLAAMNAKAQAWGMTSTYYDDPSGLSAANESSASDLLKLAQHIYTDYPQILAITRTPQTTVQNLSAAAGSASASVIVKSINDFAGNADFIGGKTGYTDQADGNLLSIFEYDGRPIFIVVLGINDGVRFDATQRLYTWFRANFK
jgi:D-alanyl-D-alanine endopeptidase (penicillin-binding protein 7)